MMGRETIQQDSQDEHYVVGIGASAGGLEPIHQLFDYMPANTGCSFVLIQHLSRDHKSLMRDLLAKHTAMEIIEARDGLKIERNHIYLIPNKNVITLEDDCLRLTEKERGTSPNMAIDTFFTSLAKEKKNFSVGIVLSGSGSDGSKGVEAIKDAGGWVVVQDPLTAEFDSMPVNAINTGKADLVLPPENIAEELIEFLQEPTFIKNIAGFNHNDEGIITSILEHIGSVTPHDFSEYKKPTIKRRLAKRMGVKGFRHIGEYFDFIREDQEEAYLLSREFLINVTKFFRDKEAFDEIRLKVIPAIFSGKTNTDPIKIWVVACSTGEEAYTLAMLLTEYMESIGAQSANVKIFATDVDREAIQHASQGLYTEAACSDIPKERLNRFFVQEGNNYRVIPSLRKMIVFAVHDVTKDPPFSKLDLISCRNMLIYMNNNLQKSVLKTFLFALQTGGTLFLGSSENTGVIHDSMKDVSKKWKIYQCIGKNRAFASDALPRRFNRNLHPPEGKPKNAFTHINDIFKETLLEENRYAGVMVDENMDVKHATGRFKDFLQFPDNNFTFNLLKLVNTDLGIALSVCMKKATKENSKSIMRNVRIGTGSTARYVSILIKPYLNPQEYQQSFYFIVLQEENILLQPIAPISGEIPTEDIRFETLEKELRETKENLQTLLEEMESANEELMTSNEEMISSNEELQSTNEELQSLNEELHTVSAEHQQKIRELIDLNDDLNNYFYNSEIGQVLVDKNMIVRKFSPVVTRQINLIETDIGRPINDITNNLQNTDLIRLIRQVIINHEPIKREVLVGEDKVYLMKINPYIRQDKTFDGVVINFIDISEIKNLNSILQGIFESSSSGILAMKTVRNSMGEIIDFLYTSSNHAAEKILDAEKGKLENQTLLRRNDVNTALFDRYISVIETGLQQRFEYYHEKKSCWFDVVAVKRLDGLVVTFNDITDKMKAAEIISKNYNDLKVTSSQLQESNHQLAQSNLDLLQFASVASHDLKEPLRKIQTFGNFLSSKIENKLEPIEKGYLDKIVNASNRMQLLIEDVLTLSKLSNREIPFSPTDLNVVLKRIIEDLEITIKEKNSIIRVDPLPTIDAVPGQMRQLFQNLIANGLKFNSSKKPEIHIQQRKITVEEENRYGIQSDQYIAICVSDNGIGFDEQFKEKIFGLFQRLNPTQYQGTGIGLAICKKIIDNHHGYIEPESKPGSGSTFIILLPRKHDLTEKANRFQVTKETS